MQEQKPCLSRTAGTPSDFKYDRVFLNLRINRVYLLLDFDGFLYGRGDPTSEQTPGHLPTTLFFL